jgi:spermidine/putrescine transport system substrate-binding protein
MTKLTSAFGPGMDRRRTLQALAAAGIVPVTMTWRPGSAEAAADLLVFDWTGYEIPELHEPYIAKYGASPEIAVYADV